MANTAAALAGVTPDLTTFGIDDSRVVAGSVELAPSELQAFVHGRCVHLTRREFEVLHVQRLRTRLAEVSPGWRFIHTHFGVGYRFEPEPVDEPSELGEQA